MKKILLMLCIIILATGCINENTVEKVEEPVKEEIVEPEEVKYIDENKMPISFYYNGNKQAEYSTTITEGVDIGVFQIYPSSEEKITYTNYGDSFYSEWMKYNNGNKIGYNLTYTLENGTTISHNILSPDDAMKYQVYLAVYVYDDYLNRYNGWYSHLEDYDENTFMTSIKLFPQSGTHEINSKIALTAFTYDSEDDFDPETNEYRGKSKSTVFICNSGKTC